MVMSHWLEAKDAQAKNRGKPIIFNEFERGYLTSLNVKSCFKPQKLSVIPHCWEGGGPVRRGGLFSTSLFSGVFRAWHRASLRLNGHRWHQAFPRGWVCVDRRRGCRCDDVSSVIGGSGGGRLEAEGGWPSIAFRSGGNLFTYHFTIDSEQAIHLARKRRQTHLRMSLCWYWYNHTHT